MESHKQAISPWATVYDGDWLSDTARNQKIWTDGFHFKNYEHFQNAIVTKDESVFKIIPNKEELIYLHECILISRGDYYMG